MEGAPTMILPVLLRNFLTSLFIFADKSVVTLAEKYKLLQLLRWLAASSFLFLLRLLPALFPSLDPSPENIVYLSKADNQGSTAVVGGGGDSGIARALSQLLEIVNNIPVSSRKYEVVRSLAERVIDENLQEDSEVLREINCRVLSVAFSRTLCQLEAAAVDRGGDEAEVAGGSGGGVNHRKVRRVFRAVRYYGGAAWNRIGKGRAESRRYGGSAEKLAAEVLWLAQKMAGCGCVEEAEYKWASATQLACLALSAEPRLQGPLVKVSAFLFKQAKDLAAEKGDEGSEEQLRQTKVKMLMSWLPLLCRANNGTDTPVLSSGEKAELERALEETIQALKEEEQEKVLSLWLHHFTHCPSSDWPNLYTSYTRWCTTSRKLLLLR